MIYHNKTQKTLQLIGYWLQSMTETLTEILFRWEPMYNLVHELEVKNVDNLKLQDCAI